MGSVVTKRQREGGTESKGGKRGAGKRGARGDLEGSGPPVLLSEITQRTHTAVTGSKGCLDGVSQEEGLLVTRTRPLLRQRVPRRKKHDSGPKRQCETARKGEILSPSFLAEAVRTHERLGLPITAEDSSLPRCKTKQERRGRVQGKNHDRTASIGSKKKT